MFAHLGGHMRVSNFYTHHAQRISMAAAIGEAAGIHKAVRIMKQARCASERAACSGAA